MGDENEKKWRRYLLERLDKLLSGQGVGSRREVKELLRKGEVAVNGEPARNPQMKIDPETDAIFVFGKRLAFHKNVYIMLNKPRDVISASRDPKDKTVIDLLPQEVRRPGLFPAGRLDKDTEGLLIITDDGGFAHRMLSPKSHVPKLYFVMLDKPADDADSDAFARGVRLADGTDCLPARLELHGDGALVTIREGRYHQVRRMFEARGKKVTALKRLRIGRLDLDPELKPGECRLLLEEEAKTALLKE